MKPWERVYTKPEPDQPQGQGWFTYAEGIGRDPWEEWQTKTGMFSPEMIAGRQKALGQAPTFGFLDEAIEQGNLLFDSTPEGRERAARARREFNESEEFYRSRAPYGEQIAAGVLGTLPLFGVGPSASSFGGRVALGAGEGAGYGFLSHLGYGEGDALTRLTDDPAGLAISTGLGAGIGAAAPVAISGVRGARDALTALANPGGRAVREETRAVNQIAETLRNKNPDGSDPLSIAEEEVANAVSRQQSGAEFAPGKPSMLADQPRVRDLGEVVGQSPGKGRDIAEERLTERQMAQHDRVTEDVRGATGKENVFEEAQRLDDEARAAAKPLYDEFYARGPMTSETLEQILATPAGKRALNRARETAANDRVDIDTLNPRDPRVLDYVKRALDDEIEAARDPITRRIETNEGRAVEQVRRAFVEEVDTLSSGTYARAREAYRGPARLKSAMEDGQKAINWQPEEIARRMAELTPAEQRMFQLGFGRAMQNKIGSVPDGGDSARRLVGNPAIRDKVAAVVGPERAEELFKRLRDERQFYETFNTVLRGSPTARRLAAMADAQEGMTIQDLAELSRGNMVSPIVRRLGMWMGNRLRGRNERVREHIAKIIFDPDPQNQLRHIAALREAIKRVITKEEMATQASRLAVPGAAQQMPADRAPGRAANDNDDGGPPPGGGTPNAAEGKPWQRTYAKPPKPANDVGDGYVEAGSVTAGLQGVPGSVGPNVMRIIGRKVTATPVDGVFKPGSGKPVVVRRSSVGLAVEDTSGRYADAPEARVIYEQEWSGDQFIHRLHFADDESAAAWKAFQDGGAPAVAFRQVTYIHTAHGRSRIVRLPSAQGSAPAAPPPVQRDNVVPLPPRPVPKPDEWRKAASLPQEPIA